MTLSDKLYYQYWGKANKAGNRYHLLPYHCLDVAAVGWHYFSVQDGRFSEMAESIGMGLNQFHRVFCFFLLLHDIGKFSNAFQGIVKFPDDIQLVKPDACYQYEERHDVLGFRLWKEKKLNGVVEYLLHHYVDDEIAVRKTIKNLNLLFSVFCGHHGQPPQIGNASIETYFSNTNFEAVTLYITDVAALMLKPGDLSFLGDKKSTPHLKKYSWQLAGCAVLCDWLGSDSDMFEYHNEPVSLKRYWDEIALKQARDCLHKAELFKKSVNSFQDIKVLFDFIQQPTPLQQLVSDLKLGNDPQLIILEDVTGAGKTEAAMVLVQRMLSSGLGDGLYVGLPTMATANAMYSRLAKTYSHLYQKGEKPSLVLAHSASHLSEQFSNAVTLQKQIQDTAYQDELSASNYCNAWIADNRKKALLADIGVGTIDQVLLSVLPARHQSLRLLGLSSKVLLIDEVHSYDPYVNVLLERLLAFHASQGGSAILLSATLPISIRQRLLSAYCQGRNKEAPQVIEIAYPLLTQVNGFGLFNEYPLKTRDIVKRTVSVVRLNDEQEVFNVIQKAVKQGDCVCWIRNTVGDAKNAWEMLKTFSWVQPDRLHLFHSRFAMIDRQVIEENVLQFFGNESTSEQRSGRVLIATQVIEQSLDLDADVLISDLSPIDSVIQRAGRLHRHVRDQHGNCIVSENESDQRAKPVLYIHSPVPVNDADKNWLALHKGSEWVYEDMRQLWLTAKVLFEQAVFQMPGDCRKLIEAVYGGQHEFSVPEKIITLADKVEGEKRGEISMANLNALDFTKGYSIDSNQQGWSEEVNIPTRLGADTVTIVLVIKKNQQWLPYAKKEKNDWDYSSFNIPEKQWQQVQLQINEKYKIELNALKEKNPELKWKNILPLIDELAACYDKVGGWGIVDYSLSP